MSLRVALVLLVGAALASTSADAAEGDPARFVIAIGYNAAGPDPRPTLSYADDDAARFFAQQLKGAEKGWLLTTFDGDSARNHADLADVAAPPTTRELARALGELAWHARKSQAEKRPTELVFYFAGHGDVTPAGEGYLVLADGRLTRDELYRQVVAGSPTDLNHIILDACSSYFMVNARGEDERESGAKPLTPEILDVIRSEEAARDPSAWARTGVLVSTSSSAAVHETSALASGVFSYLMRSALLGAGDSNRDGALEYGEVAAFIASASADIGDPRARLKVHARPPSQRPHAALADLGDGTVDRFLRLSGRDPARIRILDDQGLPYAELHREEGSEALVALTDAAFFIVQAGEEEALLVPRHPGAYALDALEFQPAPQKRGVPERLGALFASAYGPSYVEGFTAAGELLAPRKKRDLAPPWAAGGEPPFELSVYPFAVGAGVGAGVFALVGAVALGGNLYGFYQLEQSFTQTGTIDPTLSLAVEGMRATAYAAGLAAVAAALTGGGLWMYGLLTEESE